MGNNEDKIELIDSILKEFRSSYEQFAKQFPGWSDDPKAAEKVEWYLSIANRVIEIVGCYEVKKKVADKKSSIPPLKSESCEKS